MGFMRRTAQQREHGKACQGKTSLDQLCMRYMQTDIHERIQLECTLQEEPSAVIEGQLVVHVPRM